MQLHSGGELFDRIEGRPRFTEDEWFERAPGLHCDVPPGGEHRCLHEMGIVHRDLNPENILCGDRVEDSKIGDFGPRKGVASWQHAFSPLAVLYTSAHHGHRGHYTETSRVWKHWDPRGRTCRANAASRLEDILVERVRGIR
ncbi:unnamed protein product [Ectocarpus fasciculatus]